MSTRYKRVKQQGAALIVALVALLILSVLGISTMSDVMNQSSIVRNEQFRQRVFYAATSELNVQIEDVNRNSIGEDDPIIDDLLASSANDDDMSLDITSSDFPKLLTNPEKVILTDARIEASRADNFPACSGESIGKLKVIAGAIDTTAKLDDGRESIKSVQSQRYVYCWP